MPAAAVPILRFPRGHVSRPADLLRAAANDLASIRILIEKGATLDGTDNRGLTPLMHAAGNGNLKAVELLLAKGADVNAVSAEKPETVKNGPIALGNLTALMLAAPAGGPDVTRALLDAGAKVNAVDVRQMTPLMLAVASDHADPRTVHLLLQRGADISVKDRTGLHGSRLGEEVQLSRDPARIRIAPGQKAQDARVIIPTSVLGKLDPQPAAVRSIALPSPRPSANRSPTLRKTCPWARSPCLPKPATPSA